METPRLRRQPLLRLSHAPYSGATTPPDVSHSKTRPCDFRSPATYLAAAQQNAPTGTAESFMLIANKRFFFDSEQPQIGKKAPAGIERPVGAKSIWVYAYAHPFMGTGEPLPGPWQGLGCAKTLSRLRNTAPASLLSLLHGSGRGDVENRNVRNVRVWHRGEIEHPPRPRSQHASRSAQGQSRRFSNLGKKSVHALCVQPVSATPLVVYRLAFGSPRSFADVD